MRMLSSQVPGAHFCASVLQAKYWRPRNPIFGNPIFGNPIFGNWAFLLKWKLTGLADRSLSMIAIALS
jgi:hypothetical protein